MPKLFKLAPELQGSSGETYIYEDDKGNRFFAKHVRSNPEFALRMIEEYVTIKIMNLLGLKTPTEILLAENPKTADLILIKKQVAQGEENKVAVSDRKRKRNLRDSDSLARRAFVLDVLGITDLDEGKNNAEILYPDKAKKSRRLIDYDPLLYMQSTVLSFNKTIRYLSKDELDGVIMKPEDFVKALTKTREYFIANKAEIFKTAELIRDGVRIESLQGRLEVMEDMLMTNVPEFSPEETNHEATPDASFYLARRVERVFNFNDFKDVAFGVIPTDIAGFQIVESYAASNREAPDKVVANKLHRLQNSQEKGDCTIL